MSHNMEDEVRDLINGLEGYLVAVQGGKRRPTQMLHALSERFQTVAFTVDPIKQPPFVFDPSDPQMLGRITACVLLLQPRQPFAQIRDEKFYGSGIYAIYYKGNFESYKAISGTETPVYVGKADPQTPGAATPIAQGEKLAGRLSEHGRSIGMAANILIKDFECRYLVVKSGMQKAAEEYLIHYFRPIWNSEMQICFGIGKHGDSAVTRGNKRSPWDVMHPGRKWAAKTAEDQKSYECIIAEIHEHFAANRPIQEIDFRDLLVGSKEG